jgi:uncharacterized protein (DUF1810 family)
MSEETGMSDPFDLERFVAAQNAGATYDRVIEELRNGRKASHWMWFVFPQFTGLGRSEMARRYAIASIGEARAYVAHPVLGPRLTACTGLVAGQQGRTAREIFGEVDAQKLHSSMTLFREAAPGESLFGQVIDLYFDGREDRATMQLL